MNGKRKPRSHYVWYAHTGHWPEWPNEVVHHIDGDPTNDEFSNLQLMSAFEHKSLHTRGENNPMYGKTGESHYRWQGDDATPKAKRNRIWVAHNRVIFEKAEAAQAEAN